MIKRRFITEKDDPSKKKRKKNASADMKDEENKDFEEPTQNLFYNITFCSNKIHCDICDKEMTRHTKIFCAECKDMDICLNCFANGDEAKGHKRTHKYHVINKLNFPLFVDEWTAEEELYLLEGLEKFGFGNWADIAEHIGTDKSKEEVERHYEDVYLNSKKFVPRHMKILSQRNPQNLELRYKNTKPGDEKSQIKKKSSRANPEKREPFPLTGNRTSLTTTSLTQNKEGTNSASEIVGYMPLRKDFDIEYDNDAELLLSEMEFNDDDTEAETQMKFKILEIYNARLDERIKRKNFVIERDLLDFNKQSILDKTRTKEEKEIYNLMKVFARFNKPEDHEKLVQGIIKEKQIRQRIEELKYYRKLGLKTFEEVENYLQEKKKKDEVYQKRQKQVECFVYDSKGNRGSTPRRTRPHSRDEEGKESVEKKTNKYSAIFNEQEGRLCEKLSLPPHEYLIIKDMLIRESVKEGFVSKIFAENTFKMEKERISGVFDFLVTNNLIMDKD